MDSFNKSVQCITDITIYLRHHLVERRWLRVQQRVDKGFLWPPRPYGDSEGGYTLASIGSLIITAASQIHE